MWKGEIRDAGKEMKGVEEEIWDAGKEMKGLEEKILILGGKDERWKGREKG